MSVSSKTKGDQFEQEVARQYEAMGFSVTHNVKIGNRQIDVLASQNFAGIEVRLLIEAKFREDTLKIDEVENFLDLSRRLMGDGVIQGAHLVSSAQISAGARGEATNRPGIRILTFQELKDDMFNYTGGLLNIRVAYETSEINREYIPLKGRSARADWTTSDVATALLGWAHEGKEPLAVLVGDFGSGKSTVMRRIRYEQSLRKLANRDERIPLYFMLSKLLRFPDLWSFVTTGLYEENYVSPPITMFRNEMASGKFLLLLDGFDEIFSGATASDRAQYLRILMPLFSSSSPCIISTRPTFFQSKEEMLATLATNLPTTPTFKRVEANGLDLSGIARRVGLKSRPNFSGRSLDNVVSIAPLTHEDVLELLEKHRDELRATVDLEPSEVRDRLYKIYDLSDLMARPLLLKMIVSTIFEHGKILLDPRSTIGPSSIYELYTQMCMHRDYEKEGTVWVLSAEERLEVCRQLALVMLRSGNLEISHNEAVGAVTSAKISSLQSSAAPVSNFWSGPPQKCAFALF